MISGRRPSRPRPRIRPRPRLRPRPRPRIPGICFSCFQRGIKIEFTTPIPSSLRRNQLFSVVGSSYKGVFNPEKAEEHLFALNPRLSRRLVYNKTPTKAVFVEVACQQALHLADEVTR